MKKKLLIALGILVGLCVGFVAFINITHLNKWYNNTLINGVDVSNMTLEESKQAILGDPSQYTLTVQGRNDGKMEIKAADIDFTAATTKEFDELFKTEHKSLTFPWQKYDYAITYDVKYDEAKLKDVINKADLVAGSESYKISKPVDATYAYSEEEHALVIQPEDNGNTIVTKELTKAIKKSMKNLDHELDVTDAEAFPNMYVKPEITKDDQALNDNLETVNQKCMRWVEWKLTSDVSETFTPTDFAAITVVKDGKAKFDDTKLRALVEKFCLKYKTVGKKRTFVSHTGKTLSIKKGDYGWRIDYEKTVTQLKEALKKKVSAEDIAAYKEEPTAELEAKLKTTLTPKFLSKGYKLNPDNLAEDYDTKNYTEVDLGAQKVYIFRNGKVKYTYKVISGRNQKNRKTQTGAFNLKEKKGYRVLVGADYRTPVHWWARITWSGTGFHAAPWQNFGRWSTTYWKSHGSHGCINMRTGDAHALYKVVKINEMVFMHY